MEAFAPKAVSEEVLAFNSKFAELTGNLPGIWEIGLDKARKGGFMPAARVSAKAYDVEIGDGRTLHVVPSANPRAVLMHIHGGGFVLGGANQQDAVLERIADTVGVTCVSVGYRLAPEDPYPAAWDDCEAAALWLLENSTTVFGAPTTLMAGDSAGALLAVATLIRLRNRGLGSHIKGVSLGFGVYDSSMTPSQVLAKSGVLTTEDIARNVAAYAPDAALHQASEVSPLYADLKDLPAALFTVGTLDAMLDDSMFMYCRWLAAGGRAQLALYPGADHAFTESPHPHAKTANARIDEFLTECLERG